MDTYELKQRLLELFRSPSYKPPLLPAVALELLQLTRLPDVRIEQVTTLLGHDPLLAGQVLKVARSAAYSRGEPLRSLEEAVVRLGLARISDLFLQVSLDVKVFRAPGYAEPMNQLRRHSAFVAAAARVVSQRTTGLEDSAFLCGLLHDVGIAACLLALSGPLKHVAPDNFEQAWPCIESIHASCSELLAKLWALPPDVALVLSLHHDPAPEGRAHPLAAAVHAADCFSEQFGRGFLSDSLSEELPSALGFLGAEPAQALELEKALGAVASQLGD